MATEFNVNAYWLERGRGYMNEQRTPPEFHRLQERFLLDVLQRSRLPMRRVLEIGCGFGRITQLLAETWPDSTLTALDLSLDQLANARRYCGENPRIRFEQYDFYSGQPLPGADYDGVVAIEVFLHHPPEMVIALIRRVLDVGCYLVHIDWSEAWPWPTPEHVWVHDFPKLYAEAGRELERLRQAGAGYIAFAWPSFWWLQHYVGFEQRLRGAFACVLRNERLVIFKLAS